VVFGVTPVLVHFTLTTVIGVSPLLSGITLPAYKPPGIVIATVPTDASTKLTLPAPISALAKLPITVESVKDGNEV